MVVLRETTAKRQLRVLWERRGKRCQHRFRESEIRARIYDIQMILTKQIFRADTVSLQQICDKF